MKMQIKQFSLGPIGTNCYILSQNNECLVIDPGGDAHIVEEYLNNNKLTPLAILLTHAHFDHIGAVEEIRTKYKIDVYLHENEQDWLDDPSLNRSSLYFGENGIVTKRPEKLLSTGELEIGPFTCEVVHTPGHSPGSVTFIFRKDKFIVSGDVLFHRGIGRTDLPDASIEQLAKSIVNQLYVLPDDFNVYPGHGTNTTIGDEKQNNPFTLQF